MRSATMRWVAPCSRSTPRMQIRLLPWPSISAPMAINSSARSPISGSRAAFSKHGLAFCERRGHHQVLGPGDRHHVGGDAGTLQAACAGDDIAVLDTDVSAHRLQPQDVLVDRPRTDRAATGKRHACFTESRQQRAEHQDRCAHRLHQFVRRLERVDAAGVEQHGFVAAALGTHPHVAQQPKRGFDIAQLWQVVEPQRVGREQCRTDLRERRVLGTGNPQLAFEPASTTYQKFFHQRSICRRSSGGRTCRSRSMRRGEPPGGCQWWFGPAPVPDHSAGVSVFIDKAWICSRMRSPSTR